MSREFGSYYAGYFHAQMDTAASDCECADYEITRRWGKVLRAFAPVAYAIANVEAGDSGEDNPIMESIRQWPQIEQAMREVEDYLYPFRRVMEKAVSKAVDERGEEQS